MTISSSSGVFGYSEIREIPERLEKPENPENLENAENLENLKNPEADMKHVISVLVGNQPGVLAHIAGLFSSRGYNIDSLAVGRTEDPETSRMTIVVDGDEAILEQIRKQLQRLVPVLKVSDYSGQSYVERDLMLVKVAASAAKRLELMGLVDVFRARVVDVSVKDITIEVSGTEDKLEAMAELLSAYGIKELVRTGTVAMLRGGG